jgi:hypothetical protein
VPPHLRLLVANANTVAIAELCAATARAAAHDPLALLVEHAGTVDAVLLAVIHDTALDARSI